TGESPKCGTLRISRACCNNWVLCPHDAIRTRTREIWGLTSLNPYQGPTCAAATENERCRPGPLRTLRVNGLDFHARKTLLSRRSVGAGPAGSPTVWGSPTGVRAAVALSKRNHCK